MDPGFLERGVHIYIHILGVNDKDLRNGGIKELGSERESFKRWRDTGIWESSGMV